VAPRVLIVDDDVDVREVLRIRLERDGLEVHLARDGGEALESARMLTPDVVLLDIVMPDSDGFEVCRELKADTRTRGCAVMFLTARGASRDEASGLIAGADDYIVKPFDLDDVSTRVRLALGDGDSTATTVDTPAPAAEPAEGSEPFRLRAKILTVSDGVAEGTRDDASGRALIEHLTAAGFEVDDTAVVADGVKSVAEALRGLIGGSYPGVVLTCGGTGFGPRDLTPEGTRAVIDREAPGLAEAMREASNRPDKPFGMLSRGVCGSVGTTLVCNLPGSAAGAVECIEAILPALPHALELLAGRRPH
jgi:molybdopterin adenylyltransferase